MQKQEQGSGFHYEGFSSPNGTIVPDDLFDVLAPELGEAELRVLLYIIRRTFGFKKSSDAISLSQMVDGIKTRDGRVLDRGAGVAKSAAARAVSGLTGKGIVTASRRRSAERGHEATVYSLRFSETPLSSKRTRASSPKGLGLVLQENRQQTVRQQTEVHNGVNNGREAGGAITKNRRVSGLVPKTPEHVDYLVAEILRVCGDEHSSAYYRHLIQRIPDSRLLQFLAEIKSDGRVRNAGAVLTAKVKEYLTAQRSREVYET
jgi:hypothetical protein